MIALAEAILTTAREGDAGAPVRLAKLRLDLARAVSGHVAGEIAFLESSGRSADLDQATRSRYHDELLRWRQALMDCNCTWPPNRVQEQPAAFSRAFRPILIALRERVRWEEEQLYPKLLAIAA
jgi:hypothetical protein